MSKFKLEGRCVLTFDYSEDEEKSTHVATDFNLDISDNLNHSVYLDKDDLPTSAGAKALAICFAQGIIANIHYAHQKGFWNDAEHLRYIIAELEHGFVQIADIKKSEFDN